MARRHRRKTQKGGFLDNLSNTLSGWGSSISEGTSSIWGKTKNAASGLTGTSTTSYSTPAPMSSSTYGGKRSRRRRHMKGGFKDNTTSSTLAMNSAQISDIKTAQPQKIVGGKTRRRRGRTYGKTRRH
jgi:hypothetical protein